MIHLDGPLRRELIDLLVQFEVLQSEDGRRFVTRNSGLGKLLPRMKLSGSDRLVVGNILDFLAQWGTVEGQEALLLLLFALQDEVGEDGQQALQSFIDALSDKRRSLLDVSSVQSPTSPEAVLEKLIGEPTLVATSFLEQAIELTGPVAYIEVDKVNFIEMGTGFMISPSLLLTCHHVLPKKTLAGDAIFRFNYQQNRLGAIGPVKDFQWKEKGLFHTDAKLDYTIVELEGEPGQEWEFIPLKSGNSVKRDARVNIIQHPNGRPKQVSFRNNFVEYVDSKIIQYVTHTEQGSSGSPVFNDRWQLVALHHAGGNVREPATQRQYYRNEGIVLTAILESLPQIVRNALVAS